LGVGGYICAFAEIINTVLPIKTTESEGKRIISFIIIDNNWKLGYNTQKTRRCRNGTDQE
jgi:hypothetical protein